MQHVLTVSVFLLISLTAVTSPAADKNVAGQHQLKEHMVIEERTVQRIVTEEDNGREIEAAVGDSIRVDLRFQGGTGYSWYPDVPTDSSLQLMDSRSVDLSDPGMVGGPSMGMWYFRVLKPGKGTLSMLHYRIWEGRTHSNRNFSITLNIYEKKE